MFKKIWKHSRLRFYILNAIWNYKFWLFAKKMYRNISYQIEEGEYDMDFDYKLKRKKKTVYKKRFVGYFFENNIYLDNPGLKIEDRSTWESWKKKKLLN
jgi:hypothetical protein